MMRDYKELVERLHKRIALSYAGSPCQEDLLEAADAIEELLSSVEVEPVKRGKWLTVDISTESINKIADAVVKKLEEVEACKIALMGKSLAEIKEIEGIPVERMKALAKAEAEGRLLELPCKTVFEPTWDAGKDCDHLCPALIGGEECCGLCEKAELFVYERPCKQDDIDRLGKSVFRTREEAEAALEGAEE